MLPFPEMQDTKSTVKYIKAKERRVLNTNHTFLSLGVRWEIFLLTLGYCPLRSEDQKAMVSLYDQLCPSIVSALEPGNSKLAALSSLRLWS